MNNISGTTRTRVASDHALISPDSRVVQTLSHWKGSTIAMQISPEMGEGVRPRFRQFLASMKAGTFVSEIEAGLERFFYVLSGSVDLIHGDPRGKTLFQGCFGFIPAGQAARITASMTTELLVLEKRYVPGREKSPGIVTGNSAEIEGVPFMGDDAAKLQTLLPTGEEFDLAVNIFTFQPGAQLPFVESHVMEHGLLFLYGGGVYRLGESWYPVQAGDAIWMRAYCPQWFGALGRTPSRYIYYKDVNRPPAL